MEAVRLAMNKFQVLLSPAELKESWGEKEVSAMVLQLLILSKMVPGRGPTETGGLSRKGGWGFRALI